MVGMGGQKELVGSFFRAISLAGAGPVDGEPSLREWRRGWLFDGGSWVQ